ncbi:MAG: hypothetical protein P1U47_07210 [Zhongshania sp.]|uniref:DUF6635 family protein n=1 Tax=Zhongshania sp. TaxID=1971902 RepID=UPI002611DE33|nr:DUF6635 family protein [Zhongshania sp.]MDF1692142.1 hypothetical protein [Zhongshania sp.]
MSSGENAGQLNASSGVDDGQLSAEIEQAISQAAARYFDECRQRVPSFVRRHFTYPGAIALNRVALGWDMLRAPLNLFWAPLYSLISLLHFACVKQPRLAGLASLLARIPSGFSTQVQAQISALVMDELLNARSEDNAFEVHLLTSLQTVYRRHNHDATTDQHFAQIIEPLLNDALKQYQLTRTASADIANSLSCTVLGAFAFQKFTPGGIGVAALLASLLATELASRNFVFGETLGRWYYGVFPPEPNLSLTLGMLAGIMALLAAFAAFSGVITDPVQALLGVHRRRLMKMLDHLEHDFNEKRTSSFRPKDQFVARIMDGFDMIKSSLF